MPIDFFVWTDDADTAYCLLQRDDYKDAVSIEIFPLFSYSSFVSFYSVHSSDAHHSLISMIPQKWTKMQWQTCHACFSIRSGGGCSCSWFEINLPIFCSSALRWCRFGRHISTKFKSFFVLDSIWRFSGKLPSCQPRN